MHLKSVFLVWLSSAIAFSAAQGISAADVWQETTFKDFADGAFGDGGANMYVSAKGSIEAVNR